MYSVRRTTESHVVRSTHMPWQEGQTCAPKRAVVIQCSPVPQRGQPAPAPATATAPATAATPAPAPAPAPATGCSAIDSTFPSGSWNHATFAPPGAVQIPTSSCFMNSYRTNATPRAASSFTAAAASATSHPITVYGAVTFSFTFWMRIVASPRPPSTTIAKSSSDTTRSPRTPS